MFTYTVSQAADALCFLNTCAMIESALPGLEKEALIADEAAMIQHYKLYGRAITVTNDCRKECVLVASEVELNHLFN